MCKINPRVDFAFKKLFGIEDNKDLLMSLSNAIVSSEKQMVALVTGLSEITLSQLFNNLATNDSLRLAKYS